MDWPLPFRVMTFRLLLFLTLCLPILSKPTPLIPSQVVVIYNSTLPESKELAEFYARNRLIPPSNLIGLEVPQKTTIDLSLIHISEPTRPY